MSFEVARHDPDHGVAHDAPQPHHRAGGQRVQDQLQTRVPEKIQERSVSGTVTKTETQSGFHRPTKSFPAAIWPPIQIKPCPRPGGTRRFEPATCETIRLLQ